MHPASFPKKSETREKKSQTGTRQALFTRHFGPHADMHGHCIGCLNAYWHTHRTVPKQQPVRR